MEAKVEVPNKDAAAVTNAETEAEAAAKTAPAEQLEVTLTAKDVCV